MRNSVPTPYIVAPLLGTRTTLKLDTKEIELFVILFLFLSFLCVTKQLVSFPLVGTHCVSFKRSTVSDASQ